MYIFGKFLELQKSLKRIVKGGFVMSTILHCNRLCLQLQGLIPVLWLAITINPAWAQIDFSIHGPFPTNNVTLLDQKTPRQLGLIDMPVMSDVWGWTDPESGEEYIIATADAVHGPFPIKGEDQVSSVYNPVGGVVFARLTFAGQIIPLGVWRHPGISKLDHGDVQVFGNHVYVSGETAGFGLVIFDMRKLRNLPPCLSPMDCADPLLNAIENFAVVKNYLNDQSGRPVSISDSHNLTIDPESGFLVIHAANTEKDDIQGKIRARSTKIFKISRENPIEPTLIIDLNKFSHDGLIVRYWGPDSHHQGKILLFLANGYKHEFFEANLTEVLNNPKNGISIFQLTESDGETINVKKLSRQVTYENDCFGHQLSLSEDHRYVFLNDEVEFIIAEPSRQIVFDISSIKKPVEIFQCFYSEESVSHDSYVLGNYLYSGNYTSGLRVVEITSVEGNMCVDGKLNEVAYIDTEPRLNVFSDQLTFDITADITLKTYAQFAGIWGNFPYFRSGAIILSDSLNGLFSIRLDFSE